MTSEAQVRQGSDVISEAAKLLSGLEFSAGRGAFQEGGRVAVLVDPRLDVATSTIQLLITCHAGPGPGRAVGWSGLPIWVTQEGRGGLTKIGRLNIRGQTVISSLPLSRYVVSTYSCYGWIDEMLAVREHTVARRAVRTRGGGPAKEASRGGGEGEHVSVDGRVRASARRAGSGETELVFETDDESLEGVTVRFALVDESGETQLEGTVPLEQVQGMKRWRGYRLAQVAPSARYELVFGVTLWGLKK